MDASLKQRIINEAYKLFLTQGVERTSLCDIAKAVYKSKGAVLHYFSSKTQLIDSVVRECFLPASELPYNIYSLSLKKDLNEFVNSYKNPIERVIDSFPNATDNYNLMYYMQFMYAANKYVEDFSLSYHSLLNQEEKFILCVVENAVLNQNFIISNPQYYSRQILEASLGQTFLRLLLKK